MSQLKTTAYCLVFVTVLFTQFYISRASDGLVQFNLQKQNVSIQNLPSLLKYGLKPQFKFAENKTLNFKPATCPASQTTVKKWQVGRVSRKQYEIVNMLWRKAKIFEDVTETSIINKEHIPNATQKFGENIRFETFITRPISKTATPSYIEFYYLDETDAQTKHEDLMLKPKGNREQEKTMLQNIYTGDFRNFKPVLTHSPLFAFHINDPPYKRLKVDASQTSKSPRNVFYLNFIMSQSSSNTFKTTSPVPYTAKVTNETTNNNYMLNKSKVLTIEPPTAVSGKSSVNGQFNKTMLQKKHILYKKSPNTNKQSITFYDKIKFFEMYDLNTPMPMKTNEILEHNDDYTGDEDISNNIINNNEKKLHENIYQDSILKIRYGKKDVSEYFKDMSLIERNDSELNVTTVRSTESETNISNMSMIHRRIPSLVSRFASWIDYPFAAVYVHEPSHVHCDAASISPHWLVAAASCLSRHQKIMLGEGRSAFVTYCGESWRLPERVVYVKYTLTHPNFHPRIKPRKYLYNIGLIQVITSMTLACSSWSPISLMSHQFGATAEGSTAVAVGWGLDRYANRYVSIDLPKWPLMVYKSKVYSDSCPGFTDESQEKQEVHIENVYCLTLPPYVGERNDPVHGGLLLVGGKLIALYLQEERRSWGEQSAQYTGIWRLIPWVIEKAREPEEIDSIPIEI